MFTTRSLLKRGLQVVAGLLVVCSVQDSPAARTGAPETSSSYGQLVPAFVRNTGQAPSQAEFVSAGSGHQVFFTSGDVRIVNREHTASLWLTFVGGSAAMVEGAKPTGGVVNYVRAAGVSSNAAFGEVIYRNLWPGIDGRVASTTSGLEYTFDVSPRSDPAAIRLRYDGATAVSLDSSGDLIIESSAGRFVDRAPVVTQQLDEGRIQVPCRFVLKQGEIGFELAAYDNRYPLTIDPTLEYSTYLGGSGFDAGNAIAVDATGAAYVAGVTKYLDFPATPGGFDPTWNGGTGNQPSDAFVGKLDAAGDRFEYVTFLGGSGNDEALGVAVDAAGQVYVTGSTESDDFPTTTGAFRTAIGISHHDGFVTKLDADGSALVYSTFLGSNGSTDPVAVAVDAGQHAYVAGNTWALNLPTTAGAVGPPRTSTGKRDAFLVKFAADGSNVEYGTYVGGSYDDLVGGIAISGTGRAFMTGTTESLDLRTSPTSVQPAPAGATFRTTDQGQTWQRGNGGVRSKRVLALAIDRMAPVNVYEGTDDFGVLKSVDGGTTWAPANTGFGFRPIVYDIVTDPGASGVVLAGTSSGLYRTLDGAQSWSPVGPVVTRIAIAPSNPSFAYAVSALGAYKSSDGGASWVQVLQADARSVAVDPTNALTVFVGNGSGGVYKTTNAGASWSLSAVTQPPPMPAVLSLAVLPASPNVVYAGIANSGVVRSSDGGATWQYVSNLNVNAPSRMSFDTARGNAFYLAGEGWLAFSTDAGATWKTMSVAGNYLAVKGLAVHAGTLIAGVFASSDAFVYQIDTTSSSDGLVYGTYLGGAGPDGGRGVALDASGNAVVVASASPDFPSAPPPIGVPRIHALVRLDARGTAISVGSRIGPGGSYVIAAGVAVDSKGAAYVTGVFDDDDPRVWIDRVEQSGLVTSEYFINGVQSGLGSPAWDQASAIALDDAGDVYITGNTTASDYPTTPNAPQPHYGSGARDGFISKVSFKDVAGGDQDLARGRPVVASSTESAQYSASNAVDGNDTTRWSSQFSDPQWIYVDLGQRIALNRMVIKWETAFASEYSIQVSDDASSWLEIRHRFGSGGTEVTTDLQGSGRYVRVLGLRRATQWGYSIWSLEVYGSPTSEPPSSNLALNRPAIASSVESPSLGAALAFDGRIDTRFSSGFTDSEWIQVDLGQIINISRVVLKWETAFGADYQIQAKDNAADAWRVLASVTGGDGGTDDLTGLSGTGRYVRMFGIRRGTPWGYSLWEFEVYGTRSASRPQPEDVVIYASDAMQMHGSWARATDAASPNSTSMVTPDDGRVNAAAPVSSPVDYVDVPFNATADVPYTIWTRLKAAGNSKFNDSLWIQFSNARAGGAAVYQIGSTSGLLVNLATDSGAGSLQNWGWQNSAYWLTQPATVTFSTSGAMTLRLQVREDGVGWDQIVLSPRRYLSSSPGVVSNDTTIVRRD
jgi:F5/8 type C domain/Beta-propeller repeat